MTERDGNTMREDKASENAQVVITMELNEDIISSLGHQ